MTLDYILLTALFSVGAVSPARGQMYDRLYHSLLTPEHPRTIPLLDVNSTVNVTLGLTLIKVLEVNVNAGYLDTVMWVDLHWTDSRFSWHSSNDWEISSILLPSDRMWVPDVVMYNSITTKKILDVEEMTMVNHDGIMATFTPIQYRSTCMPSEDNSDGDNNDDVVCQLDFASWMYNGFQLDLQITNDQLSLSNYVPNTDWELVETSVERQVTFYACCPEPFPKVMVTLRLRKKQALDD